MRAIGLLSISAITASCWSLSTDTGDLTSAATRADAGTLGGDAATSGDGATSSSEGGDATVIAPPFCATHGAGALDCVDFDGTGTSIGDYGFSSHVSTNATVSLDPVTASSPPRAFLSEMLASHPDCAYASIAKDFPASLHPRVTFAFRIDPLGDPDAFGYPAVLGVNLGGNTYQLLFRSGTASRKPSALWQSLDESGTQTDTVDVSGRGKLGEWMHATLEMDFRAPPTAKLTVDGVDVSVPMARFPSAAIGQPHEFYATLGWHCHAIDYQPVAVHIDDVLVESAP